MNKAHTATAKRIARRYGLMYAASAVNNQVDPTSGPPDLTGLDEFGNELVVEVETTATLVDAVARMAKFSGRVYVAVTNKEALIDAVRLTKNTPIGVMDPKGDIVKECAALSFPALLDAPAIRKAEGNSQGGSEGNPDRAIPSGASRGYTKEAACSPATVSAAAVSPATVSPASKNPPEPIHVSPNSDHQTGQRPPSSRPPAPRRAFAIPDAAALSGSLPVGLGSDGARFTIG